MPKWVILFDNDIGLVCLT